MIQYRPDKKLSLLSLFRFSLGLLFFYVFWDDNEGFHIQDQDNQLTTTQIRCNSIKNYKKRPKLPESRYVKIWKFGCELWKFDVKKKCADTLISNLSTSIFLHVLRTSSSISLTLLQSSSLFTCSLMTDRYTAIVTGSGSGLHLQLQHLDILRVLKRTTWCRTKKEKKSLTNRNKNRD